MLDEFHGFHCLGEMNTAFFCSWQALGRESMLAVVSAEVCCLQTGRAASANYICSAWHVVVLLTINSLRNQDYNMNIKLDLIKPPRGKVEFIAILHLSYMSSL